MSSDGITIETSSITNGLLSSPNNKLKDLYSTFDTHSLSRSSSIDSSYSSNKNPLEAQTSSNHSKDSTVKLPYPVLSDHRDPSSVLVLLQKETQTSSKKILDVLKQIEDCEKRLTSNSLLEKNKKSLKYQRIQRKQQLDALRKHERRVNLQIDYITTKTEIKGLEDEQLQMMNNKTSEEYQQIEMLLKKLKQKLDQMKIYMRTRNEQMKKMGNDKPTANDDRKQSSSSSQKSPHQQLSSSDLNRKRPSSSIASTSHSNKHFKSIPHNHTKPPVVRLASRSANHQSKSHPIQTPTVRFLNKTTDLTIHSSSPTTPASSSSTLSPPLIASTSTGDTNHIPHSLQKNKTPPIVEDGEIDLEFDIDELFNDNSYSETRHLKINHHTSKTES